MSAKACPECGCEVGYDSADKCAVLVFKDRRGGLVERIELDCARAKIARLTAENAALRAERDDAVARFTAAEVQLAGGSGTGCDSPREDTDSGVCDCHGVTWIVGKGYRCKPCERAGL